MIHMDAKVIGIGTTVLLVLIFGAVVIVPQHTSPEHDQVSAIHRMRTELEEEGRLRAKELQSPLDPDADNTCDYSYAPDIRIHGARRNWLLAWGNPAYTSNQGASVLYVDGHAEFLEQQEFDAVMERFLHEYMEKYDEALAVIDPY